MADEPEELLASHGINAAAIVKKIKALIWSVREAVQGQPASQSNSRDFFVRMARQRQLTRASYGLSCDK